MRRVRAIIGVCVCVAALNCSGIAIAKSKPSTAPSAKPSAKPSAAAAPSARSIAVSVARSHNAAGIAATAAGDYPKALEQHLLAWAAAKTYLEGTGHNAGVLLEYIAIAYTDLRQDGQAEPFLRAALGEFQAHRPADPDQLATTLTRLTKLAQRKGAFDQVVQWRRLEIIQRRIVADRVQADPLASAKIREERWLELVNIVAQLSENNNTMESFDQVEAALTALDNVPSALETRLYMSIVAGLIVSIFDTSKAQHLYSNGLRLVEGMPESEQKRLHLAHFTQLLANQPYALGRIEQATAQLQTAFNYAQSVAPSPKRDALVFSISDSLSTIALKQQKYSDVIRWSQVALNAAQTDDDRANALISTAKAELALKSLPEAKRNADQALALLMPSFDLKIPHLIIKRMLLSEIYADLGEKDRALALYDSAQDSASAIRSPIFSQFDIVYVTLGTKTLQSANQAPRAYAGLAQAGRSLIDGPGRTFGVNLDSRRIFNEFRYVFKNQMRAGWLAAHDDGARPSQGVSNEAP